MVGTGKSYHVIQPDEFLRRFNVVYSDLHQWEFPTSFQTRLELMYPELELKNQPLMEVVRIRAFESDLRFRLQFFFVLEYVSAQSLKEFAALVCAGALGGG